MTSLCMNSTMYLQLALIEIETQLRTAAILWWESFPNSSEHRFNVILHVGLYGVPVNPDWEKGLN